MRRYVEWRASVPTRRSSSTSRSKKRSIVDPPVLGTWTKSTLEESDTRTSAPYRAARVHPGQIPPPARGGHCPVGAAMQGWLARPVSVGSGCVNTSRSDRHGGGVVDPARTRAGHPEHSAPGRWDEGGPTC